MRKAIVVGASSGIGRDLAKILAKNGYVVGILARREKSLLALQDEIGGSFVKVIDVTKVDEARKLLEELIYEMGGVDLVVLNAGVLFNNSPFNWKEERVVIETNVLGFAAMAHVAMSYFLKKESGHLVGISSIAALRGRCQNPSYGASKAFVSNFLEGLRAKAYRENKDIYVTDIQPGWVATDMIKGRKVFWAAASLKAAHQIYEAIKHKRIHAYITKRWRLCAWLLKIIPKSIYYKIV